MKKSTASLALLGAAATLLTVAGTATPAEAQSRTALVAPIVRYFDGCAPSYAWKHASRTDRKAAKVAMTGEYGEEGNWLLADLEHAYQGRRGHLSHPVPNLPLTYLAVKGADVAVGPTSGWCYPWQSWDVSADAKVKAN